MEPGSIDKLKHDNRLRRRKGWVDNADGEAYLESLPDVSDKVHVPEEGEKPQAESPAALSSAPQPSPAADEPATQTLDPLSPPFQEVSE